MNSFAYFLPMVGWRVTQEEMFFAVYFTVKTMDDGVVTWCLCDFAIQAYYGNRYVHMYVQDNARRIPSTERSCTFPLETDTLAVHLHIRYGTILLSTPNR